MTHLTKSSYIKIVLVCLLCLAICGSLITGFFFVNRALSAWSDRHSWVNDAETSEGGFSLDASLVNDISISWIAGKVNVEVVDDTQTNGLIQVKESNRLPALRWRHAAGKLDIDYGNFAGLLSCSRLWLSQKDMTILIPESCAHSLDTFNLDAASGEYTLSDLKCKKFAINQASGNVRIDNFESESAVIEIASGALSYNGEISDKLNVEQASGNTSVHLSSQNPLSADLSMASGELKLTLPNPDFYVHLNKMSGNFSSQYGLLTDGNTYYCQDEDSHEIHSSNHGSKINMDMMSGNFIIAK